MPIYNLKCKNCNDETEVMLSFEESKNVFCHKCQTPMERQLTAPGAFILRGQGFYKQSLKEPFSE